VAASDAYGRKGGEAMTRALVLGGGGVAGVAWEIGVIDALAQAGVCLRDADRIIGTSAGAAVGAQLCTEEALESLCARQRVPVAQSAELEVDFDVDAIANVVIGAIEEGLDQAEMRARLGALALSTDTVDESVRRAVIASRLCDHEWSSRDLTVTAVDANSGAFVTFDRHSGVDLLDAVAASCAVPGVWPPVTIGASRYIDGGVRSVVNLDLAADCDTVVVIAPSVMGFGGSVLDQVAQRRGTGVIVEVIAADDASLAAFGPNVLDPATREPSLIEGRRQGAEAAERLRLVWT
jgi:NTE family protein